MAIILFHGFAIDDLFLPLMLSISARIFSVAAVPRRHRSQRDRRRYRPLPLPISKLIVSKRYVSYLRASTNKQGQNGLGVEAQRGVVRRYLFGHQGEQIAEFAEIETGKRSDRPQPAAAMALAKGRKETLLVASVLFIARLMDSKGLDLVIADANRLTLHVLAAAEHERHMIGEPTRQALAAAKARGIKLGNPRQAKINPAKAVKQAQALRPHIERCIEAGRTSSSAIAADLNSRGVAAPNGGRWFPMEVRRARDRLSL
jgi:DNA invertase Pin-like site-specific DNA recombinase